MKTNLQMMKEVVENANKLLKQCEKQHIKYPNDKHWQSIYTNALSHYYSAKRSLENFKK